MIVYESCVSSGLDWVFLEAVGKNNYSWGLWASSYFLSFFEITGKSTRDDG